MIPIDKVIDEEQRVITEMGLSREDLGFVQDNSNGTWGIAYMIEPSSVEKVMKTLDHREKVSFICLSAMILDISFVLSTSPTLFLSLFFSPWV